MHIILSVYKEARLIKQPGSTAAARATAAVVAQTEETADARAAGPMAAEAPEAEAREAGAWEGAAQQWGEATEVVTRALTA